MERLRAGDLEMTEITQIVAELAQALGHAHDHGVVHRDVKPDNIFYDAQRGVRLGDFGLARSTTPGGTITEAGLIIGTPRYLAPEQVRARHDNRWTGRNRQGDCRTS